MTALDTPRLRLVPPEAVHAGSFAAFHASERAAPMGWARAPEEALGFFARHGEHWDRHGFGWFVLEDRATGEAIGTAGPWVPAHLPEPEVAWTLWHDADEGRGFAFEAGRAALAHAFGPLAWSTAVSYIADDNRRSIALAERLGARLDPAATLEGPGKTILVYRDPRPEGAA